jgi:arsenate reductase
VAFSAGSSPATTPNPFAISTLQQLGYSTADLRSKGWDEFAKPGAPVMDLVVTVCDNAAGEICPVWPGHPITGHWGVEDPSQFQGSDEQKRREFIRVASILKRRIESLASLPVEKLDRIDLARKILEIGNS